VISAGIAKQNTKPVQLKIKPKYATEWGILPDDKYSQLKESIRLSGQLMPIIIDQYANIVDGHNRYKILQELGREPVLELREFKDEPSAQEFVIASNLFVKESSIYLKIMKAEKLKHVFEEKARLNQQLRLPKKGQKRIPTN
jgi:ParB-like chromosome segregation protein Spo0J